MTLYHSHSVAVVVLTAIVGVLLILIGLMCYASLHVTSKRVVIHEPAVATHGTRRCSLPAIHGAHHCLQGGWARRCRVCETRPLCGSGV